MLDPPFRAGLRTAGAACAVLGLLALPRGLNGQSSPAARAAPVWLLVLRAEDSTTVAIDSAAISRLDSATFAIRTRFAFSSPMRLEIGREVNIEYDVEDLDCGAGQWRGRTSAVYADTEHVLSAPLGGEWEPVPENRRPVFNATCEYLRGSFAAALPVDRELGDVDVRPELVNRAAVTAALSQEYPPALRDLGVTGTVVVRVRIRTDGRPDLPALEVVSATRPEFGDAAWRVAAKMRFRPARLRGATVPVWVNIPVTFALQGPTAPLFEPARERRTIPAEVAPSWQHPD